MRVVFWWQYEMELLQNKTINTFVINSMEPSIGHLAKKFEIEKKNNL